MGGPGTLHAVRLHNEEKKAKQQSMQAITRFRKLFSMPRMATMSVSPAAVWATDIATMTVGAIRAGCSCVSY
jgi:hypothetical protein